MQKPQGYDEATAITGEYQPLPAGGYLCTILNAKEQTSRAGNQMLVLSLDIAEGEYEGYYKEQFKRAKEQNPEATWGCNFYQLTEGNSLPFFKGMMTSIEASNPNFIWDWKLDSLKGKKVGAIFGKEQYQGNDGKLKWSTKCVSMRSTNVIRDGNFTVPEDKYLESTPYADFEEVSKDDDMPF